MKAMRGERLAPSAVRTLQVFAVAASILAASAGWCGVQLTASGGPTSGWRLGLYPSGVPYLIGTDAQGEGTTDLAGDREIQIIKDAFRAWADVPTSAIRYQFLATAPMTPGAVDSANTIAFDSSSAWARAGVLAVSLPTFRDHEIVEGDIIVFDSAKIRWIENGPHKPASSAAGISEFNLEEVVTREIGHFSGLHASFLRTPYERPLLSAENGVVYRDSRAGPFDSVGLMYPFALDGSGGGSISTDETAAISSLYPASGFAAGTATVSGVVSYRDFEADTTEPLGAAHVMAVDPTTGDPLVSTLTRSDGSYVLKGLSPGGYWIYVEPSSPDDLGGFYPDVCDTPIDFFPQFYGAASADRRRATVLSLNAGAAISDVDLTVTRIVPSSEIVYALGGQTDSEGNRLIAKIEPDDTPDLANRLTDDDGDGEFRVVDSIQTDTDVDCFAFPALKDDTFLIQVESNSPDLFPQFALYGPGLAGPIIGATVVGDLTTPATATFSAAQSDMFVVCVSNNMPSGAPNQIYTLTIRKLSGRVPIRPLSLPTAVLSLPIGDAEVQELLGTSSEFFGNVEIERLSVQFLDVDGDAGLNTDGSDFLPPTTGVDGVVGSPNSGFSLYNDFGSVPGVFDFDVTNPDPSTQDRIVRLATATEIQPIGNGFEVTFIPEDPLRIPAERIKDELADFHVVVQTSALLHHGDDFQVIIPPGGIQLKIFLDDPRIPPIQATLFSQAYPPAGERNLYTGDLATLTTFLPDANANVDVRSNDFPIIGIDAVGDPAEQYWLSEVEVTFVGYNFGSILPFVSFFGPLVDSGSETWEMTDLLPLTDGDNESGGVNVYKDNNGDGVPQVGLSGDLLLPLEGARRFEIVDLDTIPDEIVADLLHPVFSFAEGLIQPVTAAIGGVTRAIAYPGAPRTLLTEEDFLALKDDLNLFAFKAILPLRPTSALAVPPNNTGPNLGPDFFVTIRTSNTTRALDAFIPYIQPGGVKLRNNLQAVLATGDTSFSSLANEGSAFRIDTNTTPGTTLVEVRPTTEITIKDLVNTSDPSNRGAIIGSASEGSPPLGVIGIDAVDHYSEASRSLNFFSSNIPDDADIFNTGGVLEAMTVFIDPADRPATLPADFILPVLQQSLSDPDALTTPRSGLSIHVDDGTPIGNFLDDDLDGLFDEELIDQSDNDLDGVIDESDVGDEDGTGIQGRFDPTDDIIAFIQFNDFTRSHIDVTPGPITTVSELAQSPTVAVNQSGSLQVTFPSLISRSVCESALDDVLISDPFSPPVSLDFIFVRVDHPLLLISEEAPSPCDGPGWAPEDETQIGFFAEIADTPVREWLLQDDPIGIEYNYQYMTQIPNSNAIPQLVGSDFFVSLRMGPGAQSGDSFRVRIPERGITYSSYRDTLRDRVRRTSVPPLDFSTTKIRVGTDNIPPTLTFLTPVGAANVARAVRRDGRLEFEFTVSFRFDDPDNEALVDFFFDDNNFGVDGQPIPIVGSEQTTNISDNDGQETLQFTFRFPPELANSINPEAFIYGIVNDNINPPRAVYAGFPIVISPADRAQLNLQDFLIADNRGRLFGTGAANANIPDFDQRANAIRDFELTPTGRGGLYLTGFGEVVLRGDPSPWREFIRTSNRVTFPENNNVSFPMDFARDVEPDFRRDGYYILAGDGTVYPVGAVPPPAFQLPITARFPGLDVARDMELTPTGLGLLILGENGELISLGDAPTLESFSMGFDGARDLALTPSFNGAYILDAFGMLHFLGDANRGINTANIPVFFGSDVYRAIEVTADGEGVLVMNREGQVFAAGDVSIGPNVVEPGVVPLPPGTAPGQQIEFDPSTNVVLGEAEGAFIDLEILGIGGLAERVEDIITSATSGLCAFIVREDLAGLLTKFDDDFLDDQGHDLDDLAANWKSIFDYFIVTSCRIPSSSLEVSQFPDEDGIIVVDGVMQLLLLNPQLHTFAPSDDFEELEVDLSEPELIFSERGQFFSLGPILFDQAVRFWEIGDGRGWHMNILDDDYREGIPDQADHVLAQRDFFRTRRQRRIEGDGTVFFGSERGTSQSVNNMYIFEFIEYVEASDGDPTGGWGQPIVNVLWYNEDADGILPFSNVFVPFSFDVRFDPVTREGLIVGGECATLAIVPDRTEDELVLDNTEGSESELDENDDRPGGFRFFNPLGTVADPRIQFLWDSHLYLEIENTGDADNALAGLVIPNVFSSASIVNLSELAAFTDDEIVPGQPLPETGFEGVIPLPDSLEITPEDVLELIPLGEYQRSASIIQFNLVDDLGNDTGQFSIQNDYLITFSEDDQRGDTSRVNYATLRVKALNTETSIVDDEPIGNNPIPTVVFTWRYMPETDFLPWRAFKTAEDLRKNPVSGKVPKKGRSNKPHFRGLDIKPNLPETPERSGRLSIRALPGMLK
jgi:hypothetical protein